MGKRFNRTYDNHNIGQCDIGPFTIYFFAYLNLYQDNSIFKLGLVLAAQVDDLM